MEENGSLFIELAEVPFLISLDYPIKKASNSLLILIMNLDIFETRFIPIFLVHNWIYLLNWDHKSNFLEMLCLSSLCLAIRWDDPWDKVDNYGLKRFCRDKADFVGVDSTYLKLRVKRNRYSWDLSRISSSFVIKVEHHFTSPNFESSNRIISH